MGRGRGGLSSDGGWAGDGAGILGGWGGGVKRGRGAVSIRVL